MLILHLKSDLFFTKTLQTFQDWIKSNYQVSHGNILASDKDIEQTFAEIGDDEEL